MSFGRLSASKPLRSPASRRTSCAAPGRSFAVAARRRLLPAVRAWEINWLAYNTGHDLVLPGAKEPKLEFLMYPQGETGGQMLDSLEADNFKYSITAKELTSA